MITREQAVENLYWMLRLRCEFPNHEQRAEWDFELAQANMANPILYEAAVERWEPERQRINSVCQCGCGGVRPMEGVAPPDCTRCGRTGMFECDGRTRFCGCGAGDRAMRSRFLPAPTKQPQRAPEIRRGNAGFKTSKEVAEGLAGRLF